MNILIDLSGGFDTRIVLSVLYSSGVDLNSVLINSLNNKIHTHEEDFRIATNISSKLGFKLNKKRLDDKGTIFDNKTSLDISMYTKLGCHKDFYFRTQFLRKPRFHFTGGWGELIRGFPNKPIHDFIESTSSRNRDIDNHKKFYDSSKRLLNRSINRLKEERKYNDNYELSIDLYIRGEGSNHFGKACVESFISNEYKLEPSSDPDIKKLKISNTNDKLIHNLVAYIYVRFCHVLIDFPFDGKRNLNYSNIEIAEKINNKNFPYKIKSDYNKHFFIDDKRKSPVNSSKYKPKPDDYLKEIFINKDFISNINKMH